jgi:hypothetical protein
MISAWDIYWVMQLDSISAALSWLAISGSLIVGPAALYAAVLRSMPFSDRDAEKGKATHSLCAKWTPYIAAAFLLATLLPSTKTAAAMLVIPAVANNEAIQREAGDLYGIAKDALRELAKPDVPESSK